MSKVLKSSKGKGKNLKTFTPTGIRRFFFKLELIGKRHREQVHDYGRLDPIVDTPTEHPQSFCSRGKENVPPSSPSNVRNDNSIPPRWPGRVALQNEDPLEDAVIITALDHIPFCCHEDLVTMSREQLISVALSLNAKLPSAMAIDVSHHRPSSFIRSSIELIVGLRGDVPQAPKAIRSRQDDDIHSLEDFDIQAEMNRSPPTSPLAKRGRGYDPDSSLLSPRLERLDEEEEGEEEEDGHGGVVDRQMKRRKLSAEEETDIEMVPTTPTPLPRMLRTLSHCLVQNASPTLHRVLRSQSQKMEKSLNIDTAFMNNSRPAYRYQSKAKRAKTDTESAKELHPKPIGVPRKTGRLRPVQGRRPSVPPVAVGSYRTRSRSNTAEYSSSSKTSVMGSPPEALAGIKRKRSLGLTEAERQMMSGIGEMNMGRSIDDMDMVLDN